MISRASLYQFWRARTHREQVTLLAGATALFLLTLWLLVWRPITQDNARLDEQLPRLRAQAAKVVRAGDDIERLRAQPSGGRLDVLQARSLLERSATAHGLSAGVIGKSSGDTVRIPVQFSAVSFAAWTGWVDELHRKHRLWLISCRIVALDTPGMVRIEAEFGGPAPDVR
jgi:general secretion pathway protein M